MSKPTVVIKNFLGGWNCDTPAHEMQPNELAVADNIDLNAGGYFETRLGTTALNDTFYDGKILWLKKWQRTDGTNMVLGVISKTTGYYLCQIGTAGGAITTICQVSSPEISLEFSLDYVMFLDGENYRYWDGTNVWDSIPGAPTVSPSVTAQSSGHSGVGVYYMAMTFVNNIGGESPLCPVVSVTTSTASDFAWNNIPKGNESIKARKLYRTKVGGFDVLLR